MNKSLRKLLDKEFRLPGNEKGSALFKQFSATEKVIFFGLFIIFAFTSLFLLWNVNSQFLVGIPAQGGSLEEGIVGTPRFINPILALSDADRDLTALIYSGLLKRDKNGELIPDLVESYTISDDGLTYTFKLKEKLTFHDGTPITADDVEFTILKAQDPLLKSPKRANWDGISVEILGTHEIKFVLKKPYAPFIENTTMGILPKHIWTNVDIDQFTFSLYNTEPIGSGPYELVEIKRDGGGIPQHYELRPFNDYAGSKEAYIGSLFIKFYSNEKALSDAYRNKEIESMHSIAPLEADHLKAGGARIEQHPLPRIFGVFFNQSQAPVLTHAEVRAALSLAAPRETIVKEVLNGYGTRAFGPIPPGLVPGLEPQGKDNDAVAAAALLEKNGWKRNAQGILEKKGAKNAIQTLRFSISTSNAPELRQAANLVATAWRAIGADVDVKVYELGDLNQNIIRPRKYDALLFGEVIGRDLDLFAFWHSSQRNDPGLNIALYVSAKADKLLEEARALSDRQARDSRYKQFSDLIAKDNPAVFLYSPDFIYVIPEKLRGFSLTTITTPSDRFATLPSWYIATDKVWKIFAR